MMNDRAFEYTLWGGIIAVVLLLTFSLYKANQDTNRTCDRIMGFAKTPADSMQAIIACEKIKADIGRNIAIGAGAGAIAGAAPSRR